MVIKNLWADLNLLPLNAWVFLHIMIAICALAQA